MIYKKMVMGYQNFKKEEILTPGIETVSTNRRR